MAQNKSENKLPEVSGEKGSHKHFVISFIRFMEEHGTQGLNEQQIEHQFLIPYNKSLGFEHEKGTEEWKTSWAKHNKRTFGFKKVGKRKRHKTLESLD